MTTISEIRPMTLDELLAERARYNNSLRSLQWAAMLGDPYDPAMVDHLLEAIASVDADIADIRAAVTVEERK